MALNLYPAALTESPMSDTDRLTEPIESELADHDASLRSYEVLTYPADFTLELLVNKWNEGKITLAPGQRKYVWNQLKASKLIESFLIGLPVPPVYFYQDKDDNNFLVVDGQQRLTSIAYFFSGMFGSLNGNGDEEAKPKRKPLPPFNLVGLDKKSPYYEKTYRWLKEHDVAAFNKLNNAVLRSFVMKQIFPKDDTSIFQVFERLNTGGMVLQPQEIRNCVLYGKFNDLLKQLNKHESWRKIIGRKSVDRRMRDVELILRFFAIFYNLKNYEKPMKQFLNVYMKDNRNPSDDELERKFTALFTRTSDTVVRYLGDRPFSVHAGLNAAIYDAVFTAFAKNLNKLDRPNVKGQISEVRKKYKRLLKQEKFIEWTNSATTDKDVVPKRVNRAINVFK